MIIMNNLLYINLYLYITDWILKTYFIVRIKKICSFSSIAKR